MTITEPTTTPVRLPFQEVAFDLYRDIHKAIRAELFAVTTDAGRLDPADVAGRAALAAHCADVATLLVEHAEHEDGAIDPVLQRELPDFAATIEADHEVLERRIADFRDLAAEVAVAPVADARVGLHHLYVDLASFTSAYLAHQDLEERVVMPALLQAVGLEAVLQIHEAIVGPMPPDQMARSLALMLPAMNIEDRVEFWGGFSANAPEPAIEQVWGLAVAVLEPRDLAAFARRIGL